MVTIHEVTLAVVLSVLRAIASFFRVDLVHRPPNTEQMRQLKELLKEEQKAIAQLIALIDRHLE